MQNLTFPIYLYLLKKYNGYNKDFLNAFFHFYRFVSLNKSLDLKLLFIYERSGFSEVNMNSVFSSLVFHQLLNTSFFITDLGEEYLKNCFNQENNLLQIFNDFFSQYQGESFFQNSCFSNEDEWSFGCCYCLHPTCINTNQNNSFSLRSFLKLPYKRIVLS